MTAVRGMPIAYDIGMASPNIDQFMTHDPITIERGQAINLARRLMLTHQIRHLPVVHAGRLVGIVSERDLTHLDTVPELNQSLTPIGEVMTKSVYSVRADAALCEVADQLAARRCGSAVVVDEQQRVVGLLTRGDGLRALAHLV